MNAKSTTKQRNTLNAICGDLAQQIVWHGFYLSKDDWRHLLSGTVKHWRVMPAIDRGEGPAGVVMLGMSSLLLNTSECGEAIDLALSIGNDPAAQGLKDRPVRWSQAVVLATQIVKDQE